MDKDIKTVIGENVLRYRKALGYNKITLCRKLNWKNSTDLTRIERGEIDIGVNKLQRLAAALEVTVIDLVEDWS